MIRLFALCAILVLAVLISGCTKPAPLVEYRYIERNCTTPDQVISPPVWHPVRWFVVEIEGTRYYATPDGLTLVGNLKAIRRTTDAED